MKSGIQTYLFFSQIQGVKKAGLWIRIDLLRIRIQHFCSIRIRIQAKTELSKTISFSNFVEIKIWVKSNQKYLCNSSKFFFQILPVLVLFYTFLVVKFLLKITKKCIFHWNFLIFLPLDPGSRFPIRIRIHKAAESGSNTDPDPQPCKKAPDPGSATLTLGLYLVSGPKFFPLSGSG
jgi:hypothetical protein